MYIMNHWYYYRNNNVSYESPTVTQYVSRVFEYHTKSFQYLTTFLFMKQTMPHQVDMKNVVKYWKYPLWHSNTLESYCVGLSYETPLASVTIPMVYKDPMEWMFCQIIVIPCFALGSFCSQGMQIPLFPYHPHTKMAFLSFHSQSQTWNHFLSVKTIWPRVYHEFRKMFLPISRIFARERVFQVKVS